jgi:hypothetical protein
MPLDPAQRHQIEQDAITAAWEAERLAACDDAIALLREIADLERDDDGDVILGADDNDPNDLLSRIATFLAIHDQ